MEKESTQPTLRPFLSTPHSFYGSLKDQNTLNKIYIVILLLFLFFHLIVHLLRFCYHCSFICNTFPLSWFCKKKIISYYYLLHIDCLGKLLNCTI